MTPLAIIPARAGSKRLPGKNLEVIDRHSLIEWAVIHAGQVISDFSMSSIIVSTDYEPSLPLPSLQELPLHLWYQRPDFLCADETPMMDVVRDAVEVARRARFAALPFDAVVLLQPTSPLRTAADIRAAVAMLERGVDAVISVVETKQPEIFTIGHANRMWRMAPDRHRLFIPNGAIFAITTKALDAGYDWWTAPVVSGYEMPPERSIDIDVMADLEEARRLWTLSQKT